MSEWVPGEMLRSRKEVELTRRVMKTILRVMVFILTRAGNAAEEQREEVYI